MEHTSKDLQKQYNGFLKTPFLWLEKGVFNLQQFHYSSTSYKSFNLKPVTKLRLGKLVERFVSEEIKGDESIKIIAENIQIQDNKRTVGELDCLLLQNGNPIHLEIIYKFYLYDSSVGNTEIEHWIGPNRRDSLIQKLTKLKEKQLPLLYNKKTKPYLEKLNLIAKNIRQQVYFKAQLFVPLQDYRKRFSIINNDCIVGFYIYPKELIQFSDCKFYTPTKHNWLVIPHPQLNWMNFNEFSTKIKLFLAEKNNPMYWMKQPNGELVKFFVVSWN